MRNLNKPTHFFLGAGGAKSLVAWLASTRVALPSETQIRRFTVDCSASMWRCSWRWFALALRRERRFSDLVLRSGRIMRRSFEFRMRQAQAAGGEDRPVHQWKKSMANSAGRSIAMDGRHGATAAADEAMGGPVRGKSPRSRAGAGRSSGPTADPRLAQGAGRHGQRRRTSPKTRRFVDWHGAQELLRRGYIFETIRNPICRSHCPGDKAPELSPVGQHCGGESPNSSGMSSRRSRSAKHGHAYVVDAHGRLIAPSRSKPGAEQAGFSALTQVRAAQASRRRRVGAAPYG